MLGRGALRGCWRKARPVSTVEVWVVRVLLHQGHTAVQLDMMTPGAYIATMALVATGDLAMLPDGCICEPVEVFRTETEAHAHRAQLARDNPGSDFRVILNMDVSV